MLLSTLSPNQAEARDKALQHPGFGLFAQQRVGKTLTALSIADARKPDILFIVCPLKAIRVWREQIKEHIEWDWKCTKFIVHFEGVCRSKRDRARWRRLFRKWMRDRKTILLIVDEAHRIKRRGSGQSMMLRSLTKYVTWRLALTGTPISQGREDAWAIFQFLMPGVLGRKWEDFEEKYLKIESEKRKSRTGKVYSYPKLVGYKNIQRFDKIFHRYSYRKTLREVQKEAGRAPYRVRKRVVRFDLKPETRRIYNELLTELETEVRKKRISTPLVVTLVSKLQQITGGYLIHTEPLRDKDGVPYLTKTGKAKVSKTIIPVGREKIVELLKVLNEIPNNKKVVICVQYRHEIDRIGKRLDRLGKTWKLVAGGSKFDGRFDTDAIIMQIRSGEAIDLADADIYIFYSWDYSHISHEQSKFRILKFSSTLVTYYYLMANDTVDEDIYRAVTRKENLARLVCDKYRRSLNSESVQGPRGYQARAA